MELHAEDLHTVLGRLMDRIRVSGLMLFAVEAFLGREGYAVTVRVGTEDASAVERLAEVMRKVVGVTLVRVGPVQAAPEVLAALNSRELPAIASGI